MPIILKSFTPNMIPIGLKTKVLFSHGNLVTIASKYVADAYHTKKASHQI